MDPITAAILGALAVGANEVGERVLLDAYEGLKLIIKRKFGENSKLATAVKTIEDEPEFEPNRAALEQRIVDAKASEDVDILDAARTLLTELERLRAIKPEATGVVLEDILSRAGNVSLHDKTGRGAAGRRIDAHGDVTAISEPAPDREKDPKA